MNDDDTQRLLGELHANSKHNKEKLEALEIKVETRMDALEKKISSLVSEMSLYKTVIKTVRALLLSLVAIISFKFGDISSYWTNFFNGK